MINKIKRFFWHCSGANIHVLEEHPAEGNKFAGIGATVFFTGLFAFLSSSYAFFTVFDSWWVAIMIGLGWGLMIFNLDRYIVSSMKVSGTWKNKFLRASPRIILAVFISVVIARPLELKIFEKEIDTEIALMEQEKFQEQSDAVLLKYDQYKSGLNAQLDELKSGINKKTAARDQLKAAASAEADGTGGTMRRNPGPIYQIKKAQADQVEAELNNLMLKNTTLENSIRSRLDSLDRLAAGEINSFDQVDLTGMASRLQALSGIEEEQEAVDTASWFIMILFILIETAPIFVKLMSEAGPYDNHIQLVNYNSYVQTISKAASVSRASKKKAEHWPEYEKSFLTKKLNVKLEDI